MRLSRLKLGAGRGTDARRRIHADRRAFGAAIGIVASAGVLAVTFAQRGSAATLRRDSALSIVSSPAGGDEPRGGRDAPAARRRAPRGYRGSGWNSTGAQPTSLPGGYRGSNANGADGQASSVPDGYRGSGFDGNSE